MNPPPPQTTTFPSFNTATSAPGYVMEITATPELGRMGRQPDYLSQIRPVKQTGGSDAPRYRTCVDRGTGDPPVSLSFEAKTMGGSPMPRQEPTVSNVLPPLAAASAFASYHSIVFFSPS